MEILLYQPEIPPNTGNIARLCAATQIPLHLIKPLGFSLEDRYLKRAGLDYWEFVKLFIWNSLDEYIENQTLNKRMVMTSARQGQPLQEFKFHADDVLVFGPETRGLPPELLQNSTCLNIPTMNVRSINLSTSVGIVLYQGLIQTKLIDSFI